MHYAVSVGFGKSDQEDDKPSGFQIPGFGGGGGSSGFSIPGIGGGDSGNFK